MVKNKISIKVGGPAGSGVFTIGLLISKYLQKSGLDVVYTTDYPSLIKGGHNTCSIRGEDEKIYAELKNHDILVALDFLTIKEDLKNLNKGGILICDEKEDFNSDDYRIVRVPYKSLLNDMDKRYLNTVAFGAVIGIIGPDDEIIEKTIRSHFAKKDEEVIKDNIEAVHRGYNFSLGFCSNNRCDFPRRIFKVNREKPSVFMSGNDAAGLGALKAGVKFVGEYPMTPSSSFLSFFAAHELDYNITTKHTEDELAAMNMVIGAAVGGVRSMTATSGGGFSLMNEALGFAGIAEVPLVCFECMRSGPSTGMPTYTDQGDLKFVINSSQGEFPIVVLAPGDNEEAFYESFDAFNIAEKIQTPVIVLLDKHISASQTTTDRFNTKNLTVDRGKYIELNTNNNLENYKRYRFTSDGVSPRCFPGQLGGIHVASSYEHDETGWTSEDAENHEKMMEKRFQKLLSIQKEKLIPKFYGDKDAEITIVSWGSTKGPVLEAMKYLNKDGFKVNFLHFIYLNPFDVDSVTELLKSCRDTIILEGNYTGQLRDIIREKTGFQIKNTYFKYDGRPFYFEDIYNRVRMILEGKEK